jgi:hypothetical protein
VEATTTAPLSAVNIGGPSVADSAENMQEVAPGSAVTREYLSATTSQAASSYPLTSNRSAPSPAVGASPTGIAAVSANLGALQGPDFLPACATATIVGTNEGNNCKAPNGTAGLPSGENNSELNGHYRFALRGLDATGNGIAYAGSFDADGTGNITGGVADTNTSTSGPSLNTPITAAGSSYAVGADNRGRLILVISATRYTFDFALDNISSGVAHSGYIILSTANTAISGSFNQHDSVVVGRSK